MIIKTSQMGVHPRRFSGKEPPSVLELHGEPQICSAGAVRYDLVAQRFDRDLLVRGAVEVDLEIICARCGERCRQTVRNGSFARAYPLATPNELIDLTDDMREAIFLAFPMNFTCSDGCRGLCPGCGANLNNAPCVCREIRDKTRWEELEKLNLDEK